MLPKLIFNFILVSVVYLLLAYAEKQLKNHIDNKSFKSRSLDHDLLRFIKIIHGFGYLSFVVFLWLGIYQAAFSEAEFSDSFSFNDFIGALFWSGLIFAFLFLLVVVIATLSSTTSPDKNIESRFYEKHVQNENQLKILKKNDDIIISNPTKTNSNESPPRVIEKNVDSESNAGSLQTIKIETPYLDNTNKEIVTIKSQLDQKYSKPKKIGYLPNDKFRQLNPYDYAVVKMPIENSFIKFPRKERSDKKGFTEDKFFNHLKKYFDQDFRVINDMHVPAYSGKPYEPDLIISTERDGKNIFIDIEIDEPYDGVTRIPTHCIAENDNRDDFFTQRGWIVIRFAEIQVHTEPLKCCALIAQVIYSIDPTFESSLLNLDLPTKVHQWSELESKKWASQKYRESYLGIQGFNARSNTITNYELSDSAVDQEVEKSIKPIRTKKQEKKLEGLAKQNPNLRDSRIEFNAESHTYKIDGNADTISVTTLVDKFFPEFDTDYWAQIKARQRGITTEEMIREWKNKGLEAAKKGTSLHEAIENYYNEKNYNSELKEFGFFLEFVKQFPTLKPYRPEWRIFDEDLLVAGTVDMVYEKEPGVYFMFDWKRSEKIINSSGLVINNVYQTAFGELNHLDDSSYSRYCLQQNIYRAILEKRYKMKISSMNLLVLHENYDRYHIVKVPRMEKEVAHIFETVYLTR